MVFSNFVSKIWGSAFLFARKQSENCKRDICIPVPAASLPFALDPNNRLISVQSFSNPRTPLAGIVPMSLAKRARSLPLSEEPGITGSRVRGSRTTGESIAPIALKESSPPIWRPVFTSMMPSILILVYDMRLLLASIEFKIRNQAFRIAAIQDELVVRFYLIEQMH